MSKHTAGTWKVLQGGIAGQFVVKAGEHHDTMIGIASDIDVEANAQLIAIAPELLEALELIAGEPREDAATWMRVVARAAIAKARGEA